MLAISSTNSVQLRFLLATIFVLSIALSFAADSGLWESRLDLESDRSIANAFSACLWLVVAALAGVLAKRRSLRFGWMSVAALATFVAVGEFYDIKDLIPLFSFSDEHQSEWILVAAPVAIPLLLLGSRALLTEARTSAQRALLLMAGVLAVVPLLLDSVEPPYRIAEEGSELMTSVVLIALLLSILGWVPLSPNFITWRFVAIVALLTLLPAVILDAREYRIRVAGGIGDKPEIYHGPLSRVSQSLTVDRNHLSRIEVWAESTGESAELFLRLGSPGHPPLRESRTVTNHPRWSNGTVTFDFAPIPDSAGQTYEISVGALQPEPYVFVGLSTDDPISASVVLVNEDTDSLSNDLALRLTTSGRGLKWLVTMLQDRERTDVLTGIQLFVVWLWVLVTILWLTASSFNLSKSKQETE